MFDIIIKIGVGADAALFRLLESLDGRAALQARLEDIVWRCLDIKRMMLRENKGKELLGHTVAQAVEKAQHFKGLSHGEAVSVGLAAITAFGEREGITARGTAERARNCNTRYGLPLESSIDPDVLRDCLRSIRTGEKLIIPERIGWCGVYPFDISAVDLG